MQGKVLISTLLVLIQCGQEFGKQIYPGLKGDCNLKSTPRKTAELKGDGGLGKVSWLNIGKLYLDNIIVGGSERYLDVYIVTCVCHMCYLGFINLYFFTF